MDVEGKAARKGMDTPAKGMAGDDPAVEIVQLAARLIHLQSGIRPTGRSSVRPSGPEGHGPRRTGHPNASSGVPGRNARQAAVRTGIEVLRGFGVSLNRELHEALKRDTFHYVYQPIVSVADGAVEGCEALLRWRRNRQIVAPALFLPIAEETLLIAAIQQHLLDELAAAYALLAPGAFLAVNFSPVQLADATALSALIGRIAELKLDPARIVIEITARSALTDPELTYRHVMRLKEHGFRIALDDFGSGYCNLASTGQLPLDLLKIGAPLIQDAPRSARAAVILKGIVDVAHELGQRVVAEGVESTQQLAVLRELGCDLAQGYLTGGPVPNTSGGVRF